VPGLAERVVELPLGVALQRPVVEASESLGESLRVPVHPGQTHGAHAELGDVDERRLLQLGVTDLSRGSHGDAQDVDHLDTALADVVLLHAVEVTLGRRQGGLARVALLPCLLGAPDLVLRVGGLEDRTAVVDGHIFSHF
jgi:hypothetical protein